MFKNLTLGTLFICTPTYTINMQIKAAIEQLCIPIIYLKRKDFPTNDQLFTDILKDYPTAEGVLITMIYLSEDAN